MRRDDVSPQPFDPFNPHAIGSIQEEATVRIYEIILDRIFVIA